MDRRCGWCAGLMSWYRLFAWCKVCRYDMVMDKPSPRRGRGQYIDEGYD